MILTKTTTGFVAQRYDTEKKRFIDQEFICSDDSSWENSNGDSVDAPEGKDDAEPYLNFEMKSPAEIAGINNFKKGDLVLVTPAEGDLAQHEFQGTVKGFREDNIITIEDQNGDCFDVDSYQVNSLENNL